MQSGQRQRTPATVFGDKISSSETGVNKKILRSLENEPKRGKERLRLWFLDFRRWSVVLVSKPCEHCCPVKRSGLHAAHSLAWIEIAALNTLFLWQKPPGKSGPPLHTVTHTGGGQKACVKHMGVLELHIFLWHLSPHMHFVHGSFGIMPTWHHLEIKRRIFII